VSQKPPTIGLVSLGCPKALVDSERILTDLRAQGYVISPDYEGADAVIVNTCGFLDSAKAESLEAIGEAISQNGKVIVTGCMGGEEEAIRATHPAVLAVSGPQQYEAVVSAVHNAVPPIPDPKTDLVPDCGLKLTPRHYAYLKISEGCNNTCSFCIIPDIRGKLKSRPVASVLYEAERLVKAGVRELLVISQDTSAYGVDIKFAQSKWHGREIKARFYEMAKELGSLGAWVRMHYVYPYPHVDGVIELMAEGVILPYLDIPFQHAAPSVLKSMKRPANDAKVLDRIRNWRKICPDLALRSTFIVGYPGETEEDFQYLLEWMKEAQIERAGCFKYEAVAGAKSNTLADQIPEDVKEDRWHRFMQAQSEISAGILADKVGRKIEVIIDSVDGDQAIARSKWDAPEIDGNVFIRGGHMLNPGDMVEVEITSASDYDLFVEQTLVEQTGN